jgi:hypothetical protein
MHFCRRQSSALGRAPTLEIRHKVVFGHAFGGQQRVKLCCSLLERSPFRFGTLVPGGYEVSDGISMPRDGDRAIAFQQVRREVLAKVPNAYGDGFI